RLDGLQRRDHRVEVQVGREGGQPVAVDVAARPEEGRLLAVEHHADVDELLPVHAGDAPEDDVLEPHAAHAAPTRGSHDRSPVTRAARKSTYACRTSSTPATPGGTSSHSSGTSASTSRSRSAVTCGASSLSASATPSR